ncbi:hypothetical protein BZA05DRAFT_390487 [Tricharina praecox]|uniref:uncharacterized protein n=1 Tax=Tricharina praecox TaxID=43433 RepID=UPI00222016B6|nr:uncharacterized protein BZA05DRAFT_390487 [Tricharina praecox]KAI5856056.1 hypothetical protein BZA05DRAFT_390487 [Tricharina praecox]
MPIPLFTSEKPSTSETANSPEEHSPPQQQQPSAQSSSAASPHFRAAQDELARTHARRMSIERREQTVDERAAADKLYEERIEEEYAKREGGA